VKAESKVTRIGDELFLAIPAELAEKLEIQEGSALFLEQQSLGFVVSPFPDEVSLQIHIAEKVMREDRDLLRRLADS
jgi:putative addiction module antidote